MGSPGIIIKNSHFSHIRFEPTKPQIEPLPVIEEVVALAPEPVEPTPQDERALLQFAAFERGIKIDKRWGIARLKQELDAHG